jgi:prolipoprotein diacylglyceryl transferase
MVNTRNHVVGIVGARVVSLIENWQAFLNAPIEMALFSGGLTFHGGLLLAILANFLYLRHHKIGFLPMIDAAIPSYLIAYGIARIGCHLAGDGDYGFPTTLPWGTDYSQGVHPPSLAFSGFPEIASQYPGSIVPDHTPCHPTPIYEFLICETLFLIFWRIRKNVRPEGQFLMMYLVFAGLERFFIEFLRINPRIAYGLTEAQFVAIMMICAGMIGWRMLSRKPLHT